MAPKALETFKHRIREMTCRSGGRSMEQVAEQLRRYLPGWKSYFHLAQTPRTFKGLDSWIRHRLRAVQLKHWKRGRTVYREVLKMGASSELAAMAARRVQGWWHHSQSDLNEVLTVSYFDRLGVPRLS
ncbi:MAG: group II intron maturase-specific domain-containing protein [Leptospirillia bacterium]